MSAPICRHRRLAIASRQRRQIRFRHDLGKLDRCPGEALEAKTEPDFLRIGRGVVVVQDDVGHRRFSSYQCGVISPERCRPQRNSDTARRYGFGLFQQQKVPGTR